MERNGIAAVETPINSTRMALRRSFSSYCFSR
ncbi:hypothetical protein OK016_16735 [Vibrio chagasii]|nr:hypothetical protein [Vibrio chagasii]